MSLTKLCPKKLLEIIYAITQHGGRAYLVGGCVRDYLLGQLPKDYDTEVFGLSGDELQTILKWYGKVNYVGESFGVYKLNQEWDFSLPRRDSVGRKPTVEIDSSLSTTEAAARRDFTVNAVMYCPLQQMFIDPFGGQSDLKNRILRAPGPHFMDDPLRPLRGMQFAARFNMTLEPITASYCSYVASVYDKLPVERIWGRMVEMVYAR
jgi:tRNA nucleotidyltransferase (CCA-adding enzyme)